MQNGAGTLKESLSVSYQAKSILPHSPAVMVLGTAVTPYSQDTFQDLPVLPETTLILNPIKTMGFFLYIHTYDNV